VSELTVRGLRKSFGATTVLDGVDLTVPTGTLAAVLGPSGCGKTTLLRIVAGFLAPDAGTVALDGRVVTGAGTAVPPERRQVGVVPQEGALFPHLSVAGNVGFGLSRAQRRNGRVEEMLTLVGLAGYGARMPAELSGGQQQRVALARALAPDPALVLLDEPFSALDSGLRAAVREDVRQALALAGATAVLVTHDQQEALSMAGQVAVLRDGRVVQSASPAQLYTSPGDVGVATFVGEAVLLPAVVRDGRADTVLGPLPVRGGGGAAAGGADGTVVIRPEQVRVLPAGHGVPARVLATTFYGHDALVQLALDRPGTPGTAPVRVSARSHGHEVVPDDAVVSLDVAGEVSFFPTPR
jgi:iron(III) transport system ATP-binding protein